MDLEMKQKLMNFAKAKKGRTFYYFYFINRYYINIISNKFKIFRKNDEKNLMTFVIKKI